ncbi:hypothetical protein JB92DRAFT_2996696 [Gautieria morchelliformis]|nr:hypothetical protein JB92DRAFT_2996696 [Gautieria morchelliformis]
MSSGDFSFGPMLIGTLLNTIFYGVTVVQVFTYCQTYKTDARWIRYLILYLFVCETLNTGYVIGMVYGPLVQRFTTYLPVMLYAGPIMTMIISTPVQLFISWRIKVLSHSMLLPIAISFLALCALAGGIATPVCAAIFQEFSQIRQFDVAVVAWLAASAATDIVITASLVWSSLRAGLPATGGTLNRLIRLAVQTGAITTLFASLDVVLYLAAPGTTWNLICAFPLSKLYTNSLLSSLNARAVWSNRNGDNLHPANALFGESVSALEQSTDWKRANTHTAPALELQLRRKLTHTRRKSSLNDAGKRDLQLGISITQVVERFDQSVPETQE